MKKFSLLLPAVLAASGLMANSIFNGSFEMGTNGFAIERELRLDTNPKRDFLPLATAPGAPGCGKNSLLIRNPYCEGFLLYSKDFKLEGKTEYRFSVKMKASKPGLRHQFGIFIVDPVWTAYQRNYDVPTEWKDFSFTFKTDRTGFYHLIQHPPKNYEPQSGDIQIDNLKIEKVSSPDAPVAEAAVTTGDVLYTKDVDKHADCKLVFWNALSVPYQEKITVKGVDEYTKKVLFSSLLPVSAKPGERVEIPFRFPVTRYGSVRVVAEGKNLKTHDGFYSVIGKYEAKKIDLMRCPVTGANSTRYFTAPPQSRHRAFRAWNAPFGENYRQLGRLGLRLLREWDAFEWQHLEPQPEQWDFTISETILKEYEKNNIMMYPVVGGGHLVPSKDWHDRALPGWVVKKSKVLNDKPVFDRITVAPPLDLYERHLRKLAEHFKGRIQIYEIMNEPNLYLSSEVYSQHLKAAYRAIKAGDPNAKVSGFCMTSDFGVSGSKWFRDCVKAGAMPYADIFGFHPYAGRELKSIHAADEYIQEIRKLVKSCGGNENIPLANTELFYLFDCPDSVPCQGKEFCEPHHVAKRFLIDLGENVMQSMPLDEFSLWKRLLTPHFYSFHSIHEFIPSESAVVYNTMSRLFEGAKTVGKYKYPTGAVCYVFRKDGNLIATVWNALARKGLNADFSGFQVMDLWGNPYPANAREKLEDAPFYLTAGKLPEAELLKRLEKLNTFLDCPVAFGEIARIAGNKVFLTLYNESPKEISGIAGINGKGVVCKHPVKFRIPARGHQNLEFEVRCNGPLPDKVAPSVYLSGNLFRFDLKLVENRLISRRFQTANAKGEITFGNGIIRVKADVTDPTDAGPTAGRDFWFTDCVELFFDTDPQTIPHLHANAYTPNTFRVFITPRDKQKFHSMGKVKLQKLDVKTTPDGYSFELTLNARTGKYLGFDIKVDESGKKTEIQFGNAKKLYAERSGFSIAAQ